MVRKYKRKTESQSCSLENMEQVVRAVISGSIEYKWGSNQFQVLQTTLERYVIKKPADPDYAVQSSISRAQWAEKATPLPSSLSKSDEPVEEDECMYCHDYSEKGWIRCSSCTKWAHNSSAGIKEEDEEAVHICVFL
ncbi:hypothetical protein ILUMI_10887 [Ignelater luminosus]|uniref:Uncharacterized protein n=1 Tax=Ignelater luminosus TaxID=2038154 RepID=A0A8K0GDR4_IGNLU|nr:hypothetical protein ILUMI_10887 [Ignelater luminosus]